MDFITYLAQCSRVSDWANAFKFCNHIDTLSTVSAWIHGAFINVRFAISSCVKQKWSRSRARTEGTQNEMNEKKEQKKKSSQINNLKSLIQCTAEHTHTV